MRTVTLAQLKRMSRLYADERPGGASAFINDDELAALINSQIADHDDLLIHAGGHERRETIRKGLLTAGTATLSLPTDFYEMLSLHLAWSWLLDDGVGGVGTISQLERLNALDSIDDSQDIRNHAVWARGASKAYRRRGTLIELFPTPSVETAYELRYIPASTELTADAQTFDGVNGWDRMICYRVAAEMLMIGGKSAGTLLALYEKEREKIEILAHQSTASSPDRVRDVRYQNRSSWRRLGPVPDGST